MLVYAECDRTKISLIDGTIIRYKTLRFFTQVVYPNKSALAHELVKNGNFLSFSKSTNTA